MTYQHHRYHHHRKGLGGLYSLTAPFHQDQDSNGGPIQGLILATEVGPGGIRKQVNDLHGTRTLMKYLIGIILTQPVAQRVGGFFPMVQYNPNELC